MITAGQKTTLESGFNEMSTRVFEVVHLKDLPGRHFQP